MLANRNHKPCTVMPPHSETKMITTDEFIKGMEALRLEMAQQAADRHRVNGVTHAVINDVFLRTAGQDKVLSDMTATLERIEGCLLGDSKYNKTGLITTVTAIDVRLAAVEEVVRSRTKAAVLVFGVLGVAGAVIAWLKSTGFFKFFTS
jgi:hypothetical protein